MKFELDEQNNPNKYTKGVSPSGSVLLLKPSL